MASNILNETGFPPTFVNAFVNSELKEFGLMPSGPEPFQPFFPAQILGRINVLSN